MISEKFSTNSESFNEFGRGNQVHLCQFCCDEFPDRATLNVHIKQCQIKKSSKIFNNKILSSSQLNQTQLDILDMVKLQPSNKKLTSNNFYHSIQTNDINLQIPLSNLYSHGYVSSSKQLTFDDTYCNSDNFDTFKSTINDNDESINSNILNNKLISYHIYKYSRHERDLYYNRIKRTLLRKNSLTATTTTTTTNKYRSKDILSYIFNQTNFLINIPTKIYSRQRINSNTNNIYPLLFSPNFNTLVKLSINPLLKSYLYNIRIYFHLINSIASQEFQLIVHNYDNQHQFSFTSLSFINILRQTMYDYTMNLQKTYKRNYFQSFHSEPTDDDDTADNDNDDNDNEHESTINHDNELSIPPLKIRRYDDSSYEIEKRSISSTTSSSSGMSITQINNGQQQYDDRRRLDTRFKKFPMKFSDNQINSNFNDSEKKDISDLTVGSPLQCDLSFTDHQQSQE
ncbi:unnamed protein product [Rotaria sp. Silwood2]|nr:unnamed protein product [Rotaria sp. Silwood2]CAF4511522.1 unnamed protein product [Rotaria sp. Silwood2]